MKTLYEIEQRADEINRRMAGILKELSDAKGDTDKTNDLAEELAILLHEAKVLQCSLRYFRETARQLMKDNCSGPH